MKSLFINFNDSIKEALKRLNKSGKGSLIVVDENDNFLGTLSDGDVRKSILNGEIPPLANHPASASVYLNIKWDFWKKEPKMRRHT